MARFQSFAEKSDPSNGAPRIAALRVELARLGYDGFVVPRADEHQSEYAPKNAERLAWLTGFTGSAGTAIVLGDRAALVVDGRYTLQAKAQTDTAIFTAVALAETSPEDWIAAHLPKGATLAYDPWLHTADGLSKLEKAVAKAGGALVAVDANPIDLIWADRPAAPQAPVRPHPIEFAGETVEAKLDRIRAKLRAQKCDALLVSDPHNLAWTFNLRGGDVYHTPLPLGYALVPCEGRPSLFLDPAKVTNEAGAAVGPLADFLAPDAMGAALDALGNRHKKVRIDNATGSVALIRRIEAAGGNVDVGADPISLMKAAKNAVEIEGSRKAHRRDGVAMAKFLAWLDKEAPSGQLTEIDVVERLEAYRIDTGCLKELSFPSISGAGPHAAMPHYRVSDKSNRKLGLNEIYLIDSGAQYEDGTTDITRTIIVGEPTSEMRDRFTRVLKGMIALSRAIFPKGTSGAQLDTLARQFLWQAGLDFDHGTGHGIGSYLSVHEGPGRIAKVGYTPLEAGMILSNEPGYYKTGDFGIRIENLLLVEPRAISGAEREMFGFETLTFTPIDTRLIDVASMTGDEIEWLNDYHANVYRLLADDVDPQTKTWLAAVTKPIG